MNRRQQYTLDHPLNRADDWAAIAPFTADRRHATGLLVRTILAVDR